MTETVVLDGSTGTYIDNGTVSVFDRYMWVESQCSGNTHVFGCDHAKICKCGKAKRKVEPPTCGHCGKPHC